MLDFIIKYWVEVLLGLIVSGLTIACKKLHTLWKNEKQHQKTKEQKEFYAGLENLISKSAEESRRVEASLQTQISAIKDGVLSMQKRDFIQMCRALLREDHEITIEEFASIQQEHIIYNNLGGNHEGDNWFALVKKKAEKNLTDGK